jgi:hypothetical protein
MNILKRLYYRFFIIYYILTLSNIYKLFKNYNNKSKNLILLPCKNFLDILKYILVGDSIIHDFAIINSLILNNKNYKFIFIKNVTSVMSSNIYYTPEVSFNILKLNDHGLILRLLIEELEKNKNCLFPNAYEVKFWENKEFMHTKFIENDIPHPKTIIIDLSLDYSMPPFAFPFLVKRLHSASSLGVYKINNLEEYFNLLEILKDKGDTKIILQILLNMRKDIRVIVINNKIFYHYWRINTSKDWVPTSTRHGSLVDFDNFPNKWKDFIIEQVKKLKLTTCGIDITWDNDNLDNIPMFLELSPSYQPNPPYTSKFKDHPYYKFKKSYIGKNSYLYNYINILFKIKTELFK